MKKIYTLLAACTQMGTAQAQLFDTTGMAQWPLLINSYETWMEGAFERNRDVNDATDFGWGNYDISTHLISGDSIYIIKTLAGNHKAISIDQISGGVYTVSYSNLDGSQYVTKTLDRSAFNNRNFFYYNMDQEVTKDLEPASQDWDIVFTKFLTYFPGFGGYPVAGVLHNRGVEVSQVEVQAGATATVNDTVQFPMSANISTIGYDWKDAFAGVIYDTLVYYVKDQAGNVNELKLTAYGGSGSGKMVFEVNGQADSISLGSGNAAQAYYSLQAGQQIATNTDNDWDLAFFAQSSFSAIPIRINDVNGVELYVYPKADITHWNTIGLEDEHTDRLISAYPNPAHDHITLSLYTAAGDDYTVRLIHTNGQVVKSVSYDSLNGVQEVKVPTHDMAAGIYILSVQGEHLKASTRIMVQP